MRGCQSGNSRLGFRGTEDLGGCLNASFQLESQLSVDDGGGAGTGAECAGQAGRPPTGRPAVRREWSWMQAAFLSGWALV